MIRYLVVFVCWVLFKAAHSILSGISVTLLVPIKLVIIWKVATRISSRVIILIGRMIVDWISRPPSILTTIRVNAWVCEPADIAFVIMKSVRSAIMSLVG